MLKILKMSGDYVWRTNLKLGQGKYRALRSVNSNMYKKQA
ncbi:transposase [Klebsiella pneumoniae]|nr:transposase [Klebsiella pneumoniae]